jgi:hypothetical protein
MDTVILAAIIGAVAAIVAALISVLMKKRSKEEGTRPTPRQLYILGANIAKIGWAKAVPNPESHNVKVSTTALLDDLKLPKRLTHELASFADKTESIAKLTTSLPQIKGLFGNYLASRFGKSSASFYYLGFNQVNICPMFELASLKINEVGPVVIDLLNEIEIGAQASELPTKELKSIRKLLEKGLAEKKAQLFDKARDDLIKIGEDYINILEKR